MWVSYKKLQKVRNEKIIPFLSGNVLELWCGSWFIPNFLKTNNKSNTYTGVDFREDIILKLSNDFPVYNFLQYDLDEVLEIQNEFFDTVISIAVIEHIYNQKNFFLSATNNLKINWHLVITTPSNFGNDLIYPLICKLWMRKWKWVLSDHITIFNKERFEVAAKDFWMEIIHFEFFEFFCNQLVILKKIR